MLKTDSFRFNGRGFSPQELGEVLSAKEHDASRWRKSTNDGLFTALKKFFGSTEIKHTQAKLELYDFIHETSKGKLNEDSNDQVSEQKEDTPSITESNSTHATTLTTDAISNISEEELEDSWAVIENEVLDGEGGDQVSEQKEDTASIPDSDYAASATSDAGSNTDSGYGSAIAVDTDTESDFPPTREVKKQSIYQNFLALRRLLPDEAQKLTLKIEPDEDTSGIYHVTLAIAGHAFFNKKIRQYAPQNKVTNAVYVEPEIHPDYAEAKALELAIKVQDTLVKYPLPNSEAKLLQVQQEVSEANRTNRLKPEELEQLHQLSFSRFSKSLVNPSRTHVAFNVIYQDGQSATLWLPPAMAQHITSNENINPPKHFVQILNFTAYTALDKAALLFYQHNLKADIENFRGEVGIYKPSHTLVHKKARKLLEKVHIEETDLSQLVLPSNTYPHSAELSKLVISSHNH
ncbi:MAG: DUF6389 family protein [Parashewanella sp.]